MEYSSDVRKKSPAASQSTGAAKEGHVTSDPHSSGATHRAHSVYSFVTFLRWITALFAVASVIVTVVLAVRAPNCIAIGISILRAEDCTNRDTYFLLLAASAVASICFSLLLFASAYALELLSVLAFGRRDVA
jgi:hypothetical protein